MAQPLLLLNKINDRKYIFKFTNMFSQFDVRSSSCCRTLSPCIRLTSAYVPIGKFQPKRRNDLRDAVAPIANKFSQYLLPSDLNEEPEATAKKSRHTIITIIHRVLIIIWSRLEERSEENLCRIGIRTIKKKNLFCCEDNAWSREDLKHCTDREARRARASERCLNLESLLNRRHVPFHSVLWP